MTDRDLLELIATQVGGLTKEVEYLKANMATKDELMSTKDELMSAKDELAEVKTEVKSIKETVVKIEIDHGQKLAALFDGQKQNSEKLDRIETQVSKHEEIIMRRIQ